MNTITILPYNSSYHTLWNDFIFHSKNGTFLFDRNFMEYHKDRFIDYSLLIFDDTKLVGVLPAHRVKDAVFSHQGLTYGGVVLQNNAKLRDVLSYFQALLSYLKKNGIETLYMKQIPSFYCNSFSDEIDYCMFIVQAKLYRKDCLSTIALQKPFTISKSRKENIRRGQAKGLVIKEDYNFELFWNSILIPNLSKKHGITPVHTLEEIISLHQKFPNFIKHFNVYYNNEIVAGTTVFIANEVAHPQYISGNSLKNELGSLDYLYYYLITNVFKDKLFFDFGISNEKQGRKINSGLLFWKESFGAKTVTQNFYEIQTNAFSLLNSVLL